MTDTHTTPDCEDGGWYVVRDIQRDQPKLMPRFDEIVTGPVDSVHIEQLSDQLFWMAIGKGAERLVVTFSSLNMRAHVAGRFEQDA